MTVKGTEMQTHKIWPGRNLEILELRVSDSEPMPTSGVAVQGRRGGDMSAASGPRRTVKLKVTLKFDKMSQSLTFLY